MQQNQVVNIPPNQINPPVTPIRKTSDDKGIDELVKSIQAIGIIEPLVVSFVNGSYTLVAGSRRLKAAMRLNLATVPCFVMQLSQEDTLKVALHENIYRADINPIEEGEVFHYLHTELKIPLFTIASMVGKSDPYVSQRMGSMDWNPKLRDAVLTNRIPFSVGRELARIQDPKQLEYYLGHAITSGVTARLARDWANQANTQAIPPTPAPPPKATDRAEQPPHRTYATCFFCNTDKPLDTFHQVRMCQDCYNKLLAELQVSEEELSEGVSGG